MIVGSYIQAITLICWALMLSITKEQSMNRMQIIGATKQEEEAAVCPPTLPGEIANLPTPMTHYCMKGIEVEIL
ncbi:hypothetical protein PMIT1312_00436 [Prochlorococcus marinus str. MIT 1312]|nr:hypothetical protein PMIT1312_00436 [Prochlorococcus marinus str. MIT 1312]